MIELTLSTGRLAQVELTWQPAAGDGWNEPRTPARWTFEEAWPADLSDAELDEIAAHLHRMPAPGGDDDPPYYHED